LVSASRWAILRVVSDGAGRAGGGEAVVAAVGVVEGGVGERVMVMSMATREMGCGGGFLKEEGLGVKPIRQLGGGQNFPGSVPLIG
jgi:hypothetical protein